MYILELLFVVVALIGLLGVYRAYVHNTTHEKPLPGPWMRHLPIIGILPLVLRNLIRYMSKPRGICIVCHGPLGWERDKRRDTRRC